MTALLMRLLDTIADPAIIGALLAATLVIAVVKRLYDQQHEFLRERLELLRQENEDFRRKVQELNGQIAAFQVGIAKLGDSSSALARVVPQLSAHSELGEGRFMQLLAALDKLTYVQRSGLQALQEAVKSGASTGEVAAVLGELVEMFGQAQTERDVQLRGFQARLRRIGGSPSTQESPELPGGDARLFGAGRTPPGP